MRKFFRKTSPPREMKVVGCVWMELEGGEGEKGKYQGDVDLEDFKPYMETNTRPGYIYCVTPVSRLSSGSEGTFTLKVSFDYSFHLCPL